MQDNSMKYPTLDEVEKASLEQLASWYTELPPPGYNWQNKSQKEFKARAKVEIKILARITERLVKLGQKLDITDDRSKTDFSKMAELEELDEL